MIYNGVYLCEAGRQSTFRKLQAWIEYMGRRQSESEREDKAMERVIFFNMRI